MKDDARTVGTHRVRPQKTEPRKRIGQMAGAFVGFRNLKLTWIPALRSGNQIQGPLLTANHSNQANVALLTQVLAWRTQDDNLIDPRNRGIREADSLFARFALFAVRKTIEVMTLNQNA